MARRSRPLARLHERPGQRVLEERSCGTDARGQRDRQRQRGLREAGAWGASEKRAFSELQLTGLRLARRKQEGGPALRAFMFIKTRSLTRGHDRPPRPASLPALLAPAAPSIGTRGTVDAFHPFRIVETLEAEHQNGRNHARASRCGAQPGAIIFGWGFQKSKRPL